MATASSRVAFIDIETTGLVPGQHEPWEIGLIALSETNGAWKEHRWFLPVNPAAADPVALQIGRYHERHPAGNAYKPESTGDHPRVKEVLPQNDHGLVEWAAAASDLARFTHGLHLVGAVVSFDADIVARMMRANGYTPSWHYHIIDVEALAVGAITVKAHTTLAVVPQSTTDGQPDPPERTDAARWRQAAAPPWDSNEISRIVGVDPDRFDRHTALGDCRWARAIYDQIMGGRWL